MSTESRLRLRRRLLLFSAPVVVVLLLAVLKLSSVVIAGDSAGSHFAERDADALRGDVAVLSFLNVVQPEKAHFAAGDLAVLDDRLEDADGQFSAALARTEPAALLPRSDQPRIRQGDNRRPGGGSLRRRFGARLVPQRAGHRRRCSRRVLHGQYRRRRAAQGPARWRGCPTEREDRCGARSVPSSTAPTAPTGWCRTPAAAGLDDHHHAAGRPVATQPGGGRSVRPVAADPAGCGGGAERSLARARTAWSSRRR